MRFHGLLGFIQNIRTTFAVFASSVSEVLKKALDQRIHGENFHNSSKSAKTVKFFCRLTFVIYGTTIWYDAIV